MYVQMYVRSVVLHVHAWYDATSTTNDTTHYAPSSGRPVSPSMPASSPARRLRFTLRT